MNMILIGNQGNGEIADALFQNFNIIAGVADEKSKRKAMQENYLKNKNIPIVSFEEAMQMQMDFYFIITYEKIIPKQYIQPHKIMNLHGGILPKYRGRSSNLLAILNNEEHLGYTLHFIDEGMDSGDIIAHFEIQNKLDETAEELLKRIVLKTAKELPQKIKDYFNGKVQLISQKNAKNIYSTPLRPQDGEIRNWNVKSSVIYNLFRIFGGQNGSGCFCFYRGQKYRIQNMRRAPENITDYSGIVGSVVFTDSILTGGGGGTIALSYLGENG